MARPIASDGADADYGKLRLLAKGVAQSKVENWRVV